MILLLTGVPVLTLSAKFLENSKNIELISCSLLPSNTKLKTNGKEITAKAIPIIKNKRLISLEFKKNTSPIKRVITPPKIPNQCIFLNFIFNRQVV